MRPKSVLFSALVAALLGGCAFERHGVLDPGENQVFRVESGDRHFFKLEENSAAGYTWDYTCNDSDVEVVIEHEPADTSAGIAGSSGFAKVMIRIHRGYDGPSAVTFKYRRKREKVCAKKFTITLYKVEADRAFWKE